MILQNLMQDFELKIIKKNAINLRLKYDSNS